VDAVQSSKFITEKKSRDLIKKITDLASDYEATELKRQVVVQGRVKTMNESIYYIVDDIHRAISSNRKIRFEYMRWNLEKKLEPRKDEPYEVSPWALTWVDENYYMIAYDSAECKIKHFRVDKMQKIEVTEKKREGKEFFKQFNIAAYARENFGMYGGQEVKVKLAFKNEFVGVIIDRFGKDIMIHPAKQEGWSETFVNIALSDQFLGWIFSLGTNVKIIEPAEVVQRFKKELKAMQGMYASSK
jgi:predicted DNA-binding transcriptional regulator YafY